MNTKLTKEENISIVHNLAQNNDLKFCFKLFHIDKHKHKLTWHKLIQSDISAIFLSIALFAIVLFIPLPDRTKQGIILGAPSLYIILFIIDDGKHIGNEYNSNKVKAYSNHVLNKTGINANAQYIINHKLVKQYEHDIIDLSAFAYCSNKQAEVDAILEKYTDLNMIADGLTQAWNTKMTDNFTTMRLKEQYQCLINDLINDLYKLVEPSIEQTVSKLISQKNYQYLPAELSQTIINERNEQILHDLEIQNR